MKNKIMQTVMFVTLSIPSISFSSESAMESQPIEKKEEQKEVQINTVYNFRRIWVPLVGAAIGGAFFASLPSIVATLDPNMKNSSDTVTPKELMGMSAIAGVYLNLLTVPYLLDSVQCSACGKTNNKQARENLIFWLVSILESGVCGAGICAFIHNFYPEKLPTKIGLKEAVVAMGAMGAASGFAAGIYDMKDGICVECQKEKALSQL